MWWPLVWRKQHEKKSWQISGNITSKSNGGWTELNVTTPSYRAVILISGIELLTVTADNKLKFENHTHSICRKVARQVAVLQRTKKILSFEMKNTLILSNFNYCSEVWNQCSNRCRDKLQKNKGSLQFVFSDYHSPHATLTAKIRIILL